MFDCIFSLIIGLFIGGITGTVLMDCFLYSKANAHKEAREE